MTEILLNYNKYQCAYIIPDEDSDDNIELEEGFIEEEEEGEENIEWIWEEEVETEVDGPKGPIIIKKGRYTETSSILP